jgi:hypothetical protein
MIDDSPFIKKFKAAIDTLNAQLTPPVEGPLFHYAYGKDHWQNTCDHEKDQDKVFDFRNKYIKLLYVDEKDSHNTYNAVDRVNYVGEFVVLASSFISDPDYDYKYETHIKGCKAVADEIKELIIGCTFNLSVTQWEKIEVENLYDNNLDGIRVKFTIAIGDE